MTNLSAPRQAWLTLGAIVLTLVLGISVGLYSYFTQPAPSPTPKVILAGPVNTTDLARDWVNQKEKTDKALQDKVTQVVSQQQQLTQNDNQQIAELRQEIADLKMAITQSNPAHFQQTAAPIPTPPPTIVEETLSLHPVSHTTAIPVPPRNPNTYVPAGSFATAILLQGADANAGVNGQGDTAPMVFRITDNGTLPNRRKSHLKDCFVTAAVYGDISSERGEVRLQRLSCTYQSGKIIDIPVEGTVSDQSGKNGVRGIPVTREGPLVRDAGVAGIFSGIGSAVQQAATTTSVQGGGAVSFLDPHKVWQFGVAGGVSNAMNTLSQYYIKRAEQYHPIIQISAGTPVNLLFLKGFYFDGEAPAQSSPVAEFNPNGLTPDMQTAVNQQLATLQTRGLS